MTELLAEAEVALRYFLLLRRLRLRGEHRLARRSFIASQRVADIWAGILAQRPLP